MGKPKEVLLVVDEDTGEIERQERTDLHELAIFRDLRRILRNLTPLGGRDTVGLLLKRLDACNATTRSLAEQAASSKHSQDAPEAAMRLLQEQLRHRTSINKLCWSLGAVSGTLPPDIEARFLVTSIKGLLDMTDRARGRDDKVSLSYRPSNARFLHSIPRASLPPRNHLVCFSCCTAR